MQIFVNTAMRSAINVMFVNVPSAFMNSSGQYENPPFLSSSGPQVACSPGRWRLMTERIPHLNTVVKSMFLYSPSIQSIGPLKALYTSPPGRPVHSDTNSASQGRIQPRSNYPRRRFTDISTPVYSHVLIYTAE